MPEDNEWAGWYWSDSQLLVSNTRDDRYADTAYLGTDDSAPDSNKTNGKGFAISDRTHMVALGGTVIAKYDTLKREVTVKVEATVNLHVTILNDKPVAQGGKETLQKEAVNNDLWKMREIYAQAGVRVNVVEKAANGNGLVVIPEVTDKQYRDPPQGVTLVGPAPGTPGLDQHPSKTKNGKIDLTAEEQALFGHAQYRAGADANGQLSVEVYYVNFLTRGARGLAYMASLVPDAKYANSVVISADTRPYRTLAHEVMHVLLNRDGHYGGETPRAMNRVNLMVTGGGNELAEDKVTDSRRMTNEWVEEAVAASKKVGLLK